MKTGVENYIFWSEIGSGFEEPGGLSDGKCYATFEQSRLEALKKYKKTKVYG